MKTKQTDLEIVTEPKTEETKPDPEAEARMTFTQHLGELRMRLVRSAVAVMVAAIFCYIFSDKILEIVTRPLTPLLGTAEIITPEPVAGPGDPDSPGPPSSAESAPESGAAAPVEEAEAPKVRGRAGEWTTMTFMEGFLVKLKLSAYGGILLSIPYLLFHICAFVFPGLTVGERRVVRIMIYGCSVLATLGVGIAYFGVFPIVLNYVMSFNPDWVHNQLRLNENISLILKGLLGFAVAFQFPMVVLILVYMGLLTPETLKQYRKQAIVGMFVVGAIFTPPDPLSMMMMGLPLVFLYELSIWMSYIVVRRKKKKSSSADAG